MSEMSEEADNFEKRLNELKLGASVQNNAENNGKMPGGITGKGFMPGQSGHPGGRPKRKWLTDVFDELLEEMLTDPVERANFKASQKAKLLSNKVVGAMTLDKVWERTEGKVKDEVDVTLKGNIIEILDEIRRKKHGQDSDK